MSAPTELKLLRSIKTGKGLIKLINNLKRTGEYNCPGFRVSRIGIVNKKWLVRHEPWHAGFCINPSPPYNRGDISAA